MNQPAEDTDAPRLPLHVHARGLALSVIATVAFLYALQWSRDFLVPLVLGILITYTLSPLVCWLERLRIPRLVGTTLVTAAMLGGSALVIDGLWSLFPGPEDESVIFSAGPDDEQHGLLGQIHH